MILVHIDTRVLLYIKEDSPVIHRPNDIENKYTLSKKYPIDIK